MNTHSVKSRDAESDSIRKADPRARLISQEPERMSGTPCFAGTRVPIRHLWDYLEGGDTLDDFLNGFEGISREQAIGVLQMALKRLLEGFPNE